MPKKTDNKKKKNKSDKISELKKNNLNLEEELEKNKNKNISLLAEFDNYKKRVSSQIANDKKYEGKSILINIIPVIDDIERVLLTDDSDSKSIISGVGLIKNKLLSSLEDLGVNPYDSIGEVFDPEYHEAIMTKKTKKKTDTIVEEYEKGYTYHDKVLRHAKVIVSE
tara:strand:+ start:114 stop:614 length:501 start_codon:yes stop_codon:yes gene_type:complete